MDPATQLRIEGDGVVLRPFTPDEAEDMIGGRSMVLPEATGRRDAAAQKRFEERMHNSGEWTHGFFDLAIVEGDRCVGDIQARGAQAGTYPPGTVEIGIDLWDEADRGRGIGSKAVKLFTSHLFEREAIARVQASTDIDNLAMRSVLARLGFVEEGVMRGFMPVPGGGRADYVLYGVTATEWRSDRR